MILLYSPRISSRIEYIVGLLLGKILGVDWALTKDLEKFKAYQGPRISYGNTPPEVEALHISAHGFLLERGVHYFLPELVIHEDLPLLFPVADEQYDLPFDPFSASFYMVSRYEEYLPHRKDSFGRFEATQSFAYRNNFLSKPVVNHYALMIKKLLKEKYPAYSFPPGGFTFVPTYDVDVAYAYRGRGFLRSVFGMLRSLGGADFTSLRERIRVLTKNKKDPFDTYDIQLDMAKESGIKPFFFFLCGDFGPYDRNLAHYSKAFFMLVKRLGDYARIGIHPSYASNEEEGLLTNELLRLSKILNQDIRFSRQHYLKLEMPATYRTLLRHNITFDFTMAYASQPGFRAGICTPYPFYDLELEKECRLTLVPLTVMDGTLRDYLGLTPAEGLQVARQLMAEVEEVGGCFVSLWHNDSLCDCGQWKGWLEVYNTLYAMAAAKHTKNHDKVFNT